MRNFRLLLEYEGTDYCGWQRQAEGETIQQKLEEAVARITGKAMHVQGAGRTDAGVHARGQVANFRSGTRLVPERLRDALNAVLPRDIVVLQLDEAPSGFHAQFDARSKVYVYTIRNDRVRSALDRGFVWHFRHKLNARRMRQAAAMLPGKRDFAAFQTEAYRKPNSVRTVLQARLRRRGKCVIFTIEADGFLYNMVRAIVGTLVEVGRGKISVDEFAAILESRDRRRAGPTAPPQGLCLVEVKYGEEIPV